MTTRDITQRYTKAESGVTLVELLIAMALGLLLVSATLGMVVATSRTTGTFDALSRTQETGRLALHILTRDARMAGYRGCSYGDIKTLLNQNATDYSDAIYDFGQVVFGWSESQVPSIPADVLPASFTRHYARGDVVIVKNAAVPFGSALAAPVERDDIAVQLAAAIDVPIGQLVFISDCRTGGGDLFQVTTDEQSPSQRLERNPSYLNIGPGNVDPTIDDVQHRFRAFPQSAELQLAQSNVYYVGFQEAADGTLTGSSSLRRIRMGSRIGSVPPDEELVEGVYDLRAQYGVDPSSSSSTHEYRSADAITDDEWDYVVSLRLGVLAYSSESTPETVNDDTYTVPFDETLWDFHGSEVADDTEGTLGEERFVPPDRRVYRFFSNTAAFRNRLN
ncbi:PilW family protein [Thiohalocapsa halophila]